MKASSRKAAGRRLRHSARASASSVYRAAILTAATAEFSQNGYGAAKIADIAGRAGISVGAVYRHFAGKEDIFLALMEEGSAELAAQLRLAGGAAPTQLRRLAAMIQVYLVVLDERRWMLVVYNELLHGDRGTSERLARMSQAARDQLVAPYQEVLAAARAAGEVTKAVAPEDQLAFVLGVMHGFIEAWQLAGFVTPLAPKGPVIARLIDSSLGGGS